jgi:hypothetical protein
MTGIRMSMGEYFGWEMLLASKQRGSGRAGGFRSQVTLVLVEENHLAWFGSAHHKSKQRGLP